MSGARLLTCRELVEFLWRYVSGEASPVERAELERHLALCPPCRDYLDGYRATAALVREAYGPGEEAVPGDVPQELVEAVLAATR